MISLVCFFAVVRIHLSLFTVACYWILLVFPLAVNFIIPSIHAWRGSIFCHLLLLLFLSLRVEWYVCEESVFSHFSFLKLLIIPVWAPFLGTLLLLRNFSPKYSFTSATLFFNCSYVFPPACYSCCCIFVSVCFFSG